MKNVGKERPEVEMLTGEDLHREQIIETRITNSYMRDLLREQIRIRNNVVFFFWMFILGLIGWIFAGLFMIGGMASALGG